MGHPQADYCTCPSNFHLGLVAVLQTGAGAPRQALQLPDITGRGQVTVEVEPDMRAIELLERPVIWGIGVKQRSRYQGQQGRRRCNRQDNRKGDQPSGGQVSFDLFQQLAATLFFFFFFFFFFFCFVTWLRLRIADPFEEKMESVPEHVLSGLEDTAVTLVWLEVDDRVFGNKPNAVQGSVRAQKIRVGDKVRGRLVTSFARERKLLAEEKYFLEEVVESHWQTGGDFGPVGGDCDSLKSDTESSRAAIGGGARSALLCIY